MAAPSSVKELQYRLDKAKAREDFKRTQRLNSPTPYKGKPDRTRLVYRDWYNPGLYIGVDINTGTLDLLGGGATAAGALGLFTEAAVAALPGTPSVLPNRNIKRPMVKMKWFFGDNIPTVKTTGWGTRNVSFADVKGGLKFHQAYFSSVASGATFDDIVARFIDYWTAARMSSLLGPKGAVTLLLGDAEIETLRA